MIIDSFRIYKKYGLKPALKDLVKSVRAGKEHKNQRAHYMEKIEVAMPKEMLKEYARNCGEKYTLLVAPSVKLHEQFVEVVSAYMTIAVEQYAKQLGEMSIFGLMDKALPAIVYMDELRGNEFVYKPDYAPDSLSAYNYMGNCVLINKDYLSSKEIARHISIDNIRSTWSNEASLEEATFRTIEKECNLEVGVLSAKQIWQYVKAVCGQVEIQKVVGEAEEGNRNQIFHIPEALYEDCDTKIVSAVMSNRHTTEKISVIIPNCDHVSELRRCINSLLYVEKYKNYEILIAENNSKREDTFRYYEELENMDLTGTGCKSIKVIIWDRAFNYSAINNWAVLHATGEIILLLNNDTKFVKADSLQAMADMAVRENTGAVGACLLYEDMTIQHAGVIVGIGPDRTAVHPNAGEPYENEGYRNSIHFVQNYSAVTGACLMVRKSVYEQVGGLDENYVVAYNDIDFCLKLRQIGLLNVYTPEALLYHYESKSRGSDVEGEKRARLVNEGIRLKEKWADFIKEGDPYYNKNLSKDIPWRIG